MVDVGRALKTIVFYSYKGGTGRSLLLVNTAWHLARHGKRVALLDLDLEAPGLHFKTRLIERLAGRDSRREPDHEGRPWQALPDGSAELLNSWVDERSALVNLEKMVHDVTPTNVRGDGKVGLLPAGPAPGPRYARSIERIDYRKLSEDSGRRIKFGVEDLKTGLLDLGYEYLLVDSRTGITNPGWLALSRLADDAVCLFTSTPESIDGTALVVSVLEKSPSFANRPVTVLSRVPSIVNLAETRRDAVLALNRAMDERSRLRDEDLLVLRSDPYLQANEEILIGSSTRLRRAMLQLDYMRIFERLGLPTLMVDEAEGGETAKSTTNLLQLYADFDFGAGSDEEPGEVANPDDRLSKRPRYADLQSVVHPGYRSFIARVREDFLESSGRADAEPIEAREGVSFDMMALQVFSGHLAFSCDPYYLTPTREQLVRVLPFGSVFDFGCAIVNAGRAEHSADEGGSNTFYPRILSELTGPRSELSIGMLAETAATAEVFPYLAELRPPGSIREIVLVPSIEALHRWMIDQRSTCIIVADINVLQAIGLDATTWKVSFRRPGGLPAGLVYRRGDERARAAMSVAVARALVSGGDPRAEWAQVSNALVDLGIQPLCGADLLRELLLDMELETAVEWHQKLESLAVNDRAEQHEFARSSDD